ncbi:MAG: leucine-rich repeat protein [Roseburia sp.]|nr:leucine-rich repeat protein [Roseburia sp.]
MTKKKNRRVKRTVRKTLGALFMASAIAVAAIPVENLRADNPGDDYSVGVDIEDGHIPLVDEKATIYTTGDGLFQFAYTDESTVGNRGAVILGYGGGMREGGVLTIPNEVDAYQKYPLNSDKEYGFCLVSKGGDYLFYEEITDKTDEFGNLVYEDDLTKPVLDEEGNETGKYEQKVVQERSVKPCYYEYYAKWGNLAADQFYYQSGTTTEDGVEKPSYALATTPSRQRQKATIYYIGNQRLQEGTGTQKGTWSIVPASAGGRIDTPEEGIFRGEISGNVSTLYVGADLTGIGDYAFYGCTNLSSIKLENGLDTLGNYAFANCVNLETVAIDIGARLSTVGHHAFFNCRALREFTMPRQVGVLGDSAFEGCRSMSRIDLCGQGRNVQLNKLGENVFKNCSALTELVFPDSFDQGDINIAMFEGCTSLTHITAQSGAVDFVETEDGAYGFDEFHATVPTSFYFEGVKNALLHDTSTANSFAFKYLNEDVYEITITHGGLNAVYQVNSDNKLIRCDIPTGMTEVEIPATIGPYQIKTIDSSSFQGSCALKRISIPSSITNIEANAFKGCHNLRTVIFSEPVNIQTIGPNAFQTQLVEGSHQTGCAATLEQSPVLQFVGPISYDCVPFTYAMDPASNINVGTQYRTYITYFGNWPENLQVRYNVETDKNELVNYLTFNELKEISAMTEEEATEKYPSITEGNVQEALLSVKNALDKTGMNPTNTNPLTDNEQAILSSVMDIVLPEGIETIQKGLFSTKEPQDVSYGLEKKITAYNLTEVSDEAFKGCSSLKEVNIWGNTSRIGDHAFEGCEKLDTVSVSASVTDMGVRPFANCSSLSHVNFQGSRNFSCDNSIIFGLDSDGNKYRIVEYLEGRTSGVVNAEELAGVSEIAEEAFMDTAVSYVDLRDTTVVEIPKRAFKNTDFLSFVYLPMTWGNIAEEAFADSNLQYLEIPGSQGVIDNSAFDNHVSALTFNCEVDSSARRYAMQNNIQVTDKEIVRLWTVRFWDAENNLLDTQTVRGGQDAVPPEAPVKEGYIHTGWNPDYHGVSRDMDITAQYTPEDPDAHKFTVTFLDYDGRVIDTQKVAPGEDAVAPLDPVREGYLFTGWVPGITNVTADIQPVAQYTAKDNRFVVRFFDYNGTTVLNTQLVDPGGDAILPKDPVRDGYTFTGWVPSPTNVTKDLDTYAQYETDKDSVLNNQFTVTFYDYDGVTVVNKQTVNGGEDAVLPKDPVREGYTFTGWLPQPVKISHDLDTYAQYDRDEDSIIGKQYTVNFYDYDGKTLLHTQKVAEGEDATLPKDPVREGYTFTGWLPSPTKVTQDMNTYAQYDRDDDDVTGKRYTVNFYDYDGTTLLSSQKVAEGEDAILPQNPTREGYTFKGWMPSPTKITKDMDVFATYEKDDGEGGGGGGGSDDPNPNTKFYTLTVRNGSGSGSYAAGSQPIIVAADPADGMVFDNWTIDPSDTKIASRVLSATVITMPERDVTVTANYRRGTTSSANTSGSGNSSTGSGNSPGRENTIYRPNNTTTGTSTGTKGGTTVVIDKNGLSNTGVVSATVNGSSDNFVIKITESAEASELAVRALLAEYGDITDIKYFPMDISLYDSTGNTKITDTTGLSITITLPLPDSLITYAGNNKVASVSSGTLEKLNARFTTISGVACVTFTAEHFSPYVIYVDTNHLTAGTISDSTPKTGDGIHPKWFLSIGLACISFVLFMKKDKRKPVPVKVKTKA